MNNEQWTMNHAGDRGEKTWPVRRQLFMVHGSWFIRRGSSLLLALLVLSTVLSTAIALGQIALIEIALVKANNETVIATYAAESALEQGAYRVRNYGDSLATIAAGTRTFLNSAVWTRAASPTEGSLVLRPLPKNLTRGFDFYDPESGGVGNRESVKITVDQCDTGAGDWIELGYQSFDPSTMALGTFQKIRYNCNGTNVIIFNNFISATSAYRLYVRYVQGNLAALPRLTVTGCANDYSGSGGGELPCSMPGRVDITATGTYRNSTRTMDLVMPRLSPISGIFDYGVFSECQIIKDPTVANPAC